MQRIWKTIFLVGAILLVAGSAWALPMAGDTVLMMNDWSVPYSMKYGDQVYQTFCLESHNYFKPGTTYTVASIGDYADGGGGGASGGIDYVSADTKWLYAAYFSDVFTSVSNAAQRVQNAIWYLENEIGGVQSDWNLLKNYMASFDDAGWNVVAVNISLNGADNQSQLVGVAPVPEPATMLLLGTGLLGLAGVSRRKFRRA